MRVIFNEELKAVADDLDHMVKGVRKAINGAGDALLLTQNLEAAQTIIDGDIEIDAPRSPRCRPVCEAAGQAEPGCHRSARGCFHHAFGHHLRTCGQYRPSHRRNQPAAPTRLPRCRPKTQPLFTEMQAFLNDVADHAVAMLSDRNTKTAEQIIINDDKLDELHKKTFETGSIPRIGPAPTSSSSTWC